MCLMTFKELCSKNLGAADYIALAGEFHSVALRGIPCFNSSNKPEAYRFVTLIDVLYENRIRVFCSAAGDPQELFALVMSHQDAKRSKVAVKAAEQTCHRVHASHHEAQSGNFGVPPFSQIAWPWTLLSLLYGAFESLLAMLPLK